MMNNTLIAAAVAALLLAACGGLRTAATSVSAAPAAPAAAPADAISALERACLADPLNAAHWARLAAALDADGQRERAARLYQQAATLSVHDARRDYALLAEANGKAAPRVQVEAYATLPRTQVQQVDAAMVQVVRLPASAAALPVAASTSDPVAGAVMAAKPVRLEISNGNGITGAAARLARALDVDGVKAVRLTNVKNFNVPRTRIEYPQAQQQMAATLSQRLGVPLKVRRVALPDTDLRLVLGHDASTRLRN
jgi:tetratricopeptide (TPR) repeat protein